jgi:hypothetical protein
VLGEGLYCTVIVTAVEEGVVGDIEEGEDEVALGHYPAARIEDKPKETSWVTLLGKVQAEVHRWD